MAFEGELVKLGKGRWARFQHCPIAGAAPWEGGILVAVELEERYQALLNEAEGSLGESLSSEVPMQLRLAADEQGDVRVQLEAATFH